jgi:transcriptional regulator with XRE-family HTH domain
MEAGMLRNGSYNPGHSLALWTQAMPKENHDSGPDFGRRLAELRKAAGYTQQELGDEIGVSQRVIAYYEGETAHPPASLLPKIAKALRISADELLGVAPMRRTKKAGDSRLERRLQQLEKLPPQEKRQVLQLLDAFIERGQLKRKASGQTA